MGRYRCSRGALREFCTQAGLHCQSRDYTGGHRHEWAHDRLVWQPRLSKTVVPRAWAGQARRVAGWSMVLSGLIYAGLGAFAPISDLP